MRRAIGVELVLTRRTLETAPRLSLFERLIGFVVGDAERIGHILHIGRAMCIHVAEHRFQVRTGRARFPCHKPLHTHPMAQQ